MATLLVVDDDATVLKLVVAVLEGRGHTVLPAVNGLEALMVYSSYRARIDLVVTDFDMPQMDGGELISRIRAQDPEKKILLMSGRAAGELYGVENCPTLSKPFLPNRLLAVVDWLLKNAQ